MKPLEKRVWGVIIVLTTVLIHFFPVEEIDILRVFSSLTMGRLLWEIYVPSLMVWKNEFGSS